MRVSWRVGLAVAVVAAVSSVLVGTGPASAHVSVNPGEAARGDYAKLTFRVPNERENASTVKVEVVVPAETPIASVSVRPVPGWTAEVTRSKLPTPLKLHGGEVTEAVSRITWTASSGNEIGPGQFQEFEISAGPLPEVDRIVFKTLQTYSSGEVVRWIEEPGADGTEPENPAPVLKLVGAVDEPDSSTSASPASDSAGRAGGGADGQAPWALAMAAVGLVAGLLGALFGFLAWRRVSRIG